MHRLNALAYVLVGRGFMLCEKIAQLASYRMFILTSGCFGLEKVRNVKKGQEKTSEIIHLDDLNQAVSSSLVVR